MKKDERTGPSSGHPSVSAIWPKAAAPKSAARSMPRFDPRTHVFPLVSW
jgi:hypothetical protein